MATTKKSLSARVAAGVGALALATATFVGGALPASAAENNIEDRPGSITIHKYAQEVVSPAASTGAPIDASLLRDLTPIEGVSFSVRQITDLSVQRNADWATLSTLTADQVLATDSGYQLGAARTAVTGADASRGRGEAHLAGLPLGAYVVQETSPAPVAGQPAVVIPAKPFIVVVPQPSNNDWIYDVHVYPKSTATSVQKKVEDFAPATLGERLTWTVTSNVPVETRGTPVMQGTPLSSYVISDALDATVAFVPGTIQVTVGATALPATGYTVTAPAAGTAGGTVSIDFANSIGELRAAAGQAIEVTFETEVRSVDLVDGEVPNTAVIAVNGVAATSNTVVDYWGAFEVRVHEAGNAAALLAGAVFEVRDANGNPVLGADGKPLRVTSDADGVVRIPGLRTDIDGVQYQLLLVEAPAGYRMPAETERTTTITVMKGNVTASQNFANIPVTQVPGYELPITGGTGQAAFMIGGFGLLASALGVALVRRRKAKAEA